MFWQQGRQGSGYYKLKILESWLPIPWDIYLVKYPPGSEIPEHSDPVEEKAHYRLNIELIKARVGGKFKILPQDCYINLPRIKLFKSSHSAHSVTKIVEGTRLVLSIGWVI